MVQVQGKFGLVLGSCGGRVGTAACPVSSHPMPCSHRAHTATLPAHESWPCAHSLLPPLPARMADAPSQRPYSPRGQQQGQLAGQLDGPQRCQGAPLPAPRVCMHGDGREAALPAADLNRCHEGEYGDGLGLSRSLGIERRLSKGGVGSRPIHPPPPLSLFPSLPAAPCLDHSGVSPFVEVKRHGVKGGGRVGGGMGANGQFTSLGAASFGVVACGSACGGWNLSGTGLGAQVTDLAFKA
ncbi:unnamed protein product [Closterium sp. NIES-64]|nr:unnamed protein product [Closterium sp. NIES-64]